MTSQKTIGFTYDLRADYLAMGFSQEDVAEFDTEATIDAISGTIESLGYKVDRVGNVRALCARLIKGDRWDMVFNICEGMKGRSREAQVPAVLEAFDIPYTFSDPLVCAVTLDKAVAKRLVREAGLRTPLFAVVSEVSDLRSVELRYPLFAKPIAEGTGRGIAQDSRIADADQLRRVCSRLLSELEEPVLVEEYLPGREFTVGVLGTGVHARAIGTMEVVMLPAAGGDVYSFETKERCEELVRYSRLPEGALRDAVHELAVRCYRTLGCRDGGRVDIRLDAEGFPSFMEVNPLPGLHPHHSDLPMIATQEGMAYRDLISAIVSGAVKRAGG
jgi:D-alanine-D-alanine ligase